MAAMNPELLKRLVKAALADDQKTLFSVLRQFITSERRQGHLRLADELSQILTAPRPIPGSEPRTLSPLSPSGPGGKTPASLVDVRHSHYRLHHAVLAHETQVQIRRIIEEFVHREELARHGLAPKLKILFFGPPGNGKTFTAQILANELGLPLFYVRFDALIASYLGETSSNLRRVFDFASEHMGLLLLDEFDAIGKTRDDATDVGELKRVVNTFLQLLDNYHGKSPIIASTNYERLLDYALWRRFDSLIYFPQPDQAQLQEYLNLRLSSIPSHGFDTTIASQMCSGMSYADVSRAFTDAVKSMVLNQDSSLNLGIFKPEVEHLRAAEEYRKLHSGSSTTSRG